MSFADSGAAQSPGEGVVVDQLPIPFAMRTGAAQERCPCPPARLTSTNAKLFAAFVWKPSDKDLPLDEIAGTNLVSGKVLRSHPSPNVMRDSLPAR